MAGRSRYEARRRFSKDQLWRDRLKVRPNLMLLHSNSPLDGGSVPAPNEPPPQGSDKAASLRRKLTAILIADVAGYSRLMGVDEEGTHARVATLFGDLLVPAITGHGGTCIKKTGDGFLAEFESVVQAVRCAIEIQQRVAEQNAGVIPDQKIAFRIGVNLGDVIVEADDIFGDGVNVAARLEGLASPGGIVVSRSVRDQLRDRLKVGFDDMGEQVVKNIARPVRVQLIEAETNIELWAERFDSTRKDLLDIQDQIVGRLSRAVGLQLVDIEARRSERERPVNPTALDLVMRGQAVANRPATPQTMIAARTFFQRALEHDPENVDALAGLAATYVFEVLNSYYDTGREHRLHTAKDLIRRALEIEPRHIVALKIHAAVLRAEGKFEEAVTASQAVIVQKPGEPWSYKEIGLSQLYLGRFEEALIWFEKADQIEPRDPSRWKWFGALGRVQFFLRRDEEAIRSLRLSASANPNDPRAYALLASIYALSGRNDEAGAALAACLSLRPDMTDHTVVPRLVRTSAGDQSGVSAEA